VTFTHVEGTSGPIVNDAATTGTVLCTPLSGSTAVSCAAVTDDMGNLAFRSWRGSAVDTRFSIDVTEGGIVNEGTASEPVVVTQVPFTGGMLSQSYYKVTGLVPGAAYTITKNVTGTDPVVGVFADGTYDNTLTVSAVCTVWASNDACVYEADAQGNLYIRVRDQEKVWGQTYELDVVPGGIPDQGSQEAPRDLTGTLPYDGSVNNEDSYYRITGLNPGLVYTLTASSVSDRIELSMLGRGADLPIPDFDCEANNATPGDVVCAAYPAADGTIDIDINGRFSADGATYTLDLAAGGIPNEGYSSAPVDLTGNLPYAGQVHYGISYYVVGGLTAGQSYTVSVTNPSGDVELHVAGLCISDNASLADETCAVQAPSDTLDIQVWYVGAPHGVTFTLDVQ
jgi:hypothetical protein